ncbi:hypothetical protein D3C76_1040320 [compost metagenome]
MRVVVSVRRFADDLIVYGQDDFVTGFLDIRHAIRQNVPRTGLRHVLRQLPGVGAQPFPFAAVLVDPHVGDLSVVLDARRRVAQITAARQHDAQPSAVTADLVTTTGQRLTGVVDRVAASVLQFLPVADSVRVRFAPQPLEGFANDERFFRQAVSALTLADMPFHEVARFTSHHFRNSVPCVFRHQLQVDVERERESDERADASGVAQGQLHRFADLTHEVVDIFRRAAERFRIGQDVEVETLTDWLLLFVVPADHGIKVAERLKLPFFTGQPCELAPFDV